MDDSDLYGLEDILAMVDGERAEAQSYLSEAVQLLSRARPAVVAAAGDPALQIDINRFLKDHDV